MSGLQYYVIDIESSGLNSSYHEATEISIIRCIDRVQLTEMIKCDYPERANFDSLLITKKTLADLDKGKSKEEVIQRINKFLASDGLTPAHRCFIAHNWSFDKKFTHALYAKVGQECPVDLWLCTMALTRAYAKQMKIVKPKVNLQASCELLGVKKQAGAHASKIDTRNTYLLWQNLIEEKQINYLPMIKTAKHQLKTMVSEEEEGLDPSLLDLEE